MRVEREGLKRCKRRGEEDKREEREVERGEREPGGREILTEIKS